MSGALDLMHALRLDDGRLWGEAAVGWQRADAAAVLDPGPGDPRLHWLGRPKGGSKSTDLAGMALAWLSEAAPLQDGYAVAADRDQANRLLDKARGFIARSGLDDVLEVQSHRIVHRESGARVNALEADVASAEGLLTPFVVVDELPNWAATPTARGVWTAVVSAVPKWPGMRLVVIGHAGDPAHWSRKVLDVAVAHGWRVNEVPGPLPWVSERDLEMQRAMLLPSEYARRHLNRWTTAEDRLTTAEDLAACVTLDGPLGPEADRLYVSALDVGLKNDRTVALVASIPTWWDGRAPRVRLDRVAVWQGSRDDPVALDDVESWLLTAVRDYGSPLIFDPYQAASTTQRLRAMGVAVHEYSFTATSVGRLARRLFQVISDHAIDLPDDAELIDELANVRLIERSPGQWRLDHDSGRHDDRAVTLALACWALLDGEIYSFEAGDGVDVEELNAAFFGDVDGSISVF